MPLSNARVSWASQVVADFQVPIRAAVIAYGRCRLANRLPARKRVAAMRAIVRFLERARRAS